MYTYVSLLLISSSEVVLGFGFWVLVLGFGFGLGPGPMTNLANGGSSSTAQYHYPFCNSPLSTQRGTLFGELNLQNRSLIVFTRKAVQSLMKTIIHTQFMAVSKCVRAN